MAICDMCGNDYPNAFTVTQGDRSYTFDSFQCAINKMAPICPMCGASVIGHGVDRDGVTYCCAQCASR